jgi:hypothetical protein
MTILEAVLLGYLRKNCRGSARARKTWKVAEDLEALGLDVTAQVLAEALEALRLQGVPIVIGTGESPAVFLDETGAARRRREQLRAGWRNARRCGCRPRPCRLPAKAGCGAGKHEGGKTREGNT